MIRNLTIILCLFCLLLIASCQSSVTGPSGSEVESFENAQVVLPSDGEITIRWVIPPLDHDAIEKSRRNRRHLKFVVGPEGTPWIGYNKKYLMNPVKQVWVEVLKSYQDLTQLENGVIFISKPTEFGFMVAAKRRKARSSTLVAVQPISRLPVPNCRMFRGADNCLYFSGLNKSTSLYEVYLLRPENVIADGQKRKTLAGYKHIFSSPKTINAVSGDGNTTYIATGNAILSVRPDIKAAETVFMHPNQSITQLQYNTESGLFYSTNDKIGYVGKNGHLEFYSRARTQMALNKTSLYVFSEDDFGVLAFDHIDDLSRMNLHINKMVPNRQSKLAAEKPEVFAQLGHMSDDYCTGVGAVAFSHDGRYVISGAGSMSDGLVKIWDSTGQEIRTFSGLKGGVQFVTMSPDNKYALAFDSDNLKAWDIFKGKVILTIPIPENRPVWAAFSLKGKTISVFGSKTLDIWEVSSGSKIRTITNLRDIDNMVSNNNKYVFAHDSSNSDDVIIYDAITGDPVKRVKSFAGELPAFSDNCVYAANGMSHFGEIYLSNFKNGERATIKITGRPMKLFISRDGEFVGAIVDGSKISDELPHKYSFRVWKFSNGENISNIMLPDNIDLPFSTSPVAPSPDWSQLVVGGKDGSVKFVDIATAKELLSIVAEQENQKWMARGFDRYITTLPNDTWIFWDVHEGAPVEQSEFTKEEILPYFSKNSFNEEKTIMMSSNATSSDQNHHAKMFNGTVKLYDSKTDQEIAQFIHYTDGEWIVITPEGYYNASPNGKKHLSVRIGLDVYGIENSSENFFRPDLVKAALANVGAEQVSDALSPILQQEESLEAAKETHYNAER